MDTTTTERPTNYDNPFAEIETLHDEAEDLFDLANASGTTPKERVRLRRSATAKVKKAARLRAQVEALG